MTDYSSYSTEELQQLLCSHVHNTQFYAISPRCILRCKADCGTSRRSQARSLSRNNPEW